MSWLFTLLFSFLSGLWRHVSLCALSHISDHPEHPYGDVMKEKTLDPCPLPSSCPHRAWLTLTCAPSRGPEMNATPWRERERERSVPLKLTLKTPPCPRSAFTVLQSVVLTAFLWTVWDHAGWRLWFILCVCVWEREVVCDQWFLLTMCHTCVIHCQSMKNVFSNKCWAFRKRPRLILLS